MGVFNDGNRSRPPLPSIDLFEMQVTLTTLCKCLHDSGQIPAARFQTELHKTRFNTMLQMYPYHSGAANFQKAALSENILTHCLDFGGGGHLALDLFQTCKALALKLKSSPNLLPGIYVSLSPKEMLEWHPVPGLLRLKLDPAIDCSISPKFTLSHTAQSQHRDTLYTCGGGFGGTLRRMTNAAFAFHKTSGRWECLPPMLKKREGHSAAVLGRKLYVCGGLNDEFAQDSSGEESVHGTVECFDPTAGTWSQLPRMLTRRYYHACAAFQGRLYICGGKSPDKSGGEGQLATVESFQPWERRWIEMPSMLQERSLHMAPFLLKPVNSKLFAHGGTSSTMMECYDSAGWSQIPTFGLGNAGCLALTACQGHLYILTQDSAETKAGLTDLTEASMHRFDADTGMWRAIHLTVQCEPVYFGQN